MPNAVKRHRVLIFPAGSEIGFEINNALKFAKDIEVYGGTSVHDHSEMVYTNLIKDLPNINDPSFLEEFNKALLENRIEFVYPALDAVQAFLANHSSALEATLISSPKSTVNLCRSKEKTYEHFAGSWFLPQVYRDPSKVTSFPVFVKPSIGQGSQGAEVIYDKKMLDQKYSEGDMVICEYLPGEEYTVDCFTDTGNLAYANIRTRSRIRTGISVRSHRIPMPDDIHKMAEEINESLDFKGAWFFQVKRNAKGEPRLMEISPRIPGTMATSRVEGINFPLLTIYKFLGYDIELINNDLDILLERAFINRYKVDFDFSTVYIDFDDTLILRGKINTPVIAFLYQMQNEGKRIILLTRHAKDIHESLAQYAISESLFERIVHLRSDQRKSDFIDIDDAIFIDDSFSERLQVKQAKGVPVFDLDALEALINWKID